MSDRFFFHVYSYSIAIEDAQKKNKKNFIPFRRLKN